MASLNIRIPDTLAARLGTLASQTGRTKSYYVRAALERQLEDLEDYFLAVQSLEDVATGQSKIWTQEQLEQDDDLAD